MGRIGGKNRDTHHSRELVSVEKNRDTHHSRELVSVTFAEKLIVGIGGCPDLVPQIPTGKTGIEPGFTLKPRFDPGFRSFSS